MTQTPPPNPSGDFSFPPPSGASKGGRVEQQGVFEMVWDCQFCGNKGIPAKTHKFCPNCGSPQNPATRRFPSDAEKKAVADYEFKGASLVCPACQALNDGDAKFCRQCGAPLENAAKAERVGDQVKAAGAQFAADAERNIHQEALDADLARARASAPKKGGIPWLTIAIITVIAVVLIGIIGALTWKKTVPAQVTQLNWERVIAIEAYSAVAGGTWCDSIPGDAYSISRSQRQRSTNRIPDGEVCSVRRIDNGDGTFREQEECQTRYREEPVYDAYCAYTVNRWAYSRDVTDSGILGERDPAWPTLNLRSGSGLGSEREGGRTETYRVVLHSGDDSYTCELDYAVWRSLTVGMSRDLPVGVVTGSPDCSALAQ